MNIRRLLLFVGFGTALFFAGFVLKAQDNSHYNEACSYLYNNEPMRFDSISNNCSTDEMLFLKSYNWFWAGLLKSDFTQYFNLAESAIKKHKLNGNPDLDALFFLLQMRVELTQKNYLRTISLSEKLRNYFETQDLNKSNETNIFLWGLYNYFVGEAREVFLYKSILFSWPESNKTTGIQLLQGLTGSKSVFIRTEANYILGKIFLELEHKPRQAKGKFALLINKYPNNKVFQELYDECLTQTKKQDYAAN